MPDDYIYEYHDLNGEPTYLDVTEGMLASDYLESKLPKTVVYNFDEDTEQHYSLKPHDALITAYEQCKGNYNWITYKNREDYPIKCISNRTLILGSFTCLLNSENNDYIYTLEENEYREFLDILDSPPIVTEELYNLLNNKSPWEE